MALADIYQKATLVQIPSGYKAADAELYSVVPNTTAGDFTVSVAAGATRVNKDGLVESVAANQARLDYNPSNPQDPTLLLEPSRTNNILQSNDPSGANWTDPLSRWALLTDTTTAPDGGTVRIIELTESGGSLIRLTGFSIAAGTYTVSFYMKDIDGNLTGGTVDIGDEGSAAPSPTFQNIGSNFVRASITITITGTKTYLDLQPSFSGSTNKVAIWGCQLEAGSYATSLIPTTTEAVTRTVDTCSLPNFSNIPTDYPLTVYWKGEVKEFSGTNSAFSILKDGEAGVFLVVSFNTSSQVLVRRADGSGEEVDFISFSYSIGDILKIGIKFTSTTTFKLFINGALVHNETSGISKTWLFNSVLIGQYRIVADEGFRNPCNELMLFNEALTDAELITLTS